MEAPTAFEVAVLSWLSDHCDDAALKAQLTDVSILERKYTGVGCYSTLRTPPDAPQTSQHYAERGPLSGPTFEADAVEHGGGTLLWFNGGRADCLEIFVFGDHFPQEVVGFLLLPPPPEPHGGR